MAPVPMRRLALCVLFCLPGFSCSEMQADRAAADKFQIGQSLELYLPLLGQAYATGDVSMLAGRAAEKEISRIKRRIEDLSYQGRTLVPTFKTLTVEEVRIWNNSNAFVTTLETWDLVVYASGSDTVLSEARDQPNRVKYQLKREGEQWRILFRTIQE